jgi:hypothetical protein
VQNNGSHICANQRSISPVELGKMLWQKQGEKPSRTGLWLRLESMNDLPQNCTVLEMELNQERVINPIRIHPKMALKHKDRVGFLIQQFSRPKQKGNWILYWKVSYLRFLRSH